MFEEFTVRSEDFKKTLDTFQNRISILCANFEQLFQKRLETLICESLVSVDARLCSFKKTFEILRFKLKSYTSELGSYLRADQEVPQYCNNINLILKDLDALKNNNLSDQIHKIVEGVSLTSPIAEKFEAGCNFDEELCRVIDGIVILLNKKVKSMQYELNNAKMKLNQDYQPPKEKPMEKKESDEASTVTLSKQEEPEKEEESEQEGPSIESKKSSLVQPLLGDDMGYEYTKSPDNERKYESKVVITEEKKVESPPVVNNIEKDKIVNNVNKIVREEESGKIVKAKKADKAKTLKQEESEDLKRFAVSLLLKGERSSRGGDMGNGKYMVDEEGKSGKDREEKSLTREMRKQSRVSMGMEHPRISKKIIKPKRRSGQRERDGERKIGKHISPDIMHKKGRIRWRDREASDSDSQKSEEMERENKTWMQAEDVSEKPLFLFDKEKGGT